MKKTPAKRRPYLTGNAALDKQIQSMVEKAKGFKYGPYIHDIMVTAFKIIEDAIDPADVRMLTIALKELRYAFKVFHPYEHVRKIALFGSARVPPESKDYKQAKEFARLIANEGWMVITGAASGIMSAGNEGAGRENSFGVNIQLPFEQEANPTIIDDQKLINFKYFFTRKLIFMRESDATILFPGGFGTHDEGFETLTLIQTGKALPRPVVCLDPPGSKYWKSFRYFLQHELVKRKLIDPEDMGLIHFTHDPKDAVDFVAHFYHNYQSLRFIGDRIVIRMKRPITRVRLAKINRDFKDLIKSGTVQQQDEALPEEEDELHTLGLQRLIFRSTKRHYARLHALIHEINKH